MNNFTAVKIFSAISIVFRLVGIPLVMGVIYSQIKTFKTRSNVQPLKKLLFVLVVIFFLSDLVPLLANLYRVKHGHSMQTIIALASLSNAITFLMSAVVLHLIYNFKVKE